jgi:hypothetical protein
MHVEIPHFLPGFGHHHPGSTPKGHHPIRVVAGLVIGVLLVGTLGGALLFGKATSDRTPHAVPSSHTIRFEVDGSAASVSYSAGPGTPRRVGSLQLPWSREIEVLTPEAAALIARDRGSGYVACRIYVDEHLRSSQESTGADAVATCAVTARR